MDHLVWSLLFHKFRRPVLLLLTAPLPHCIESITTDYAEFRFVLPRTKLETLLVTIIYLACRNRAYTDIYIPYYLFWLFQIDWNAYFVVWTIVNVIFYLKTSFHRINLKTPWQANVAHFNLDTICTPHWLYHFEKPT